MEGHEYGAEHVERGHERGNQRECEYYCADYIAVAEGVGQDFVLAPETREWDYSGETEAADYECDISLGHGNPQAAHVAHVEGAGGVVDAAGAEEQQRLEEGVREQVEDCRAVSARAEREHHIAQLTYGGVGENALDVVRHESHGCGEYGGDAADDGDGVHCGDGQLEYGEEARHEEYARGDHRCGVDERADGRGSFHSVGQPCVERELGGLAHRAGEYAERDPLRGNDSEQAHLYALVQVGYDEHIQALRGEGVAVEEQEQDAEQEAEVREAGDDEGFLRGCRCRGAVEPEAYQQV